jgi:hypothetical protein
MKNFVKSKIIFVYFAMLLTLVFAFNSNTSAQTIAPNSGVLTNGTRSVSYSINLTGTATNNGWTCSLSLSSGSLPTGLTLSQTSGSGTATGSISGVPTVTGTFNFSILFNCVNGGGQSQQSVTNNYTLTIQAPTSASVILNGRVIDYFGKGVSKAKINLLDTFTGNVYFASTNAFGYFHFQELNAEGYYILEVRHKRYIFEPMSFSLKENLNNLIISPSY